MNFGDLRSAVHAEQNRERRIKEVLASYEGDPYQALQYVRGSGAVLFVGKWYCANGMYEQFNKSAIAALFGKWTDKYAAFLEVYALSGFVNVGGKRFKVVEIPPDSPQVYQQWALDCVRKPALQAWVDWFGDSDDPDVQRLTALYRALVGCHYPLFIEKPKAYWAMFKAQDEAKKLHRVVNRRREIPRSGDLSNVLAFSKEALHAMSRIESFSALKVGDAIKHTHPRVLPLGQWLVGQYGWNALEAS